MPQDLPYLVAFLAVEFGVIALAIICGGWFLVRKLATVGEILERTWELSRCYDYISDLEIKNNELNEMLHLATQRINFQEKNQGDLRKRLDEQYWKAATDIATLYNEAMPAGHILALNKKNRLALFSQMLNGEWREVGYWDYEKHQLMYYQDKTKEGVK